MWSGTVFRARCTSRRAAAVLGLLTPADRARIELALDIVRHLDGTYYGPDVVVLLRRVLGLEVNASDSVHGEMLTRPDILCSTCGCWYWEHVIHFTKACGAFVP